eukprot:747558-Hanusia_phi.AAC.1
MERSGRRRRRLDGGRRRRLDGGRRRQEQLKCCYRVPSCHVVYTYATASSPAPRPVEREGKRRCEDITGGAGADVQENFLDNTFLWDRKTTIRKYLQDNPSIMQEQPPAALRDRYSG